MATNKIQYYLLSFTATGTCKSYDELKQWCLDDDCYQKLYPSIANSILLESLIDFGENENNRPEKSGIANSTLYRKPNGRKIDSSRNYKLVREADGLEIFHLYVEITKGQNRGHFKMLKNFMEGQFLLTVALEKMSETGINTIAKDLKDAADKENLFISRERCEFINRCVLANVAVTTRTTTTLFDVKTLGNDNRQRAKQQQQTATALSKPSTAATKKLVVSMSQCSAKSSDDEQEDKSDLTPELMPKNTRLTPKLKRLRPRTTGADAKELASSSCKSSTSSSSSRNKRKDDKTDYGNMKQMPKKKKH